MATELEIRQKLDIFINKDLTRVNNLKRRYEKTLKKEEKALDKLKWYDFKAKKLLKNRIERTIDLLANFQGEYVGMKRIRDELWKVK